MQEVRTTMLCTMYIVQELQVAARGCVPTISTSLFYTKCNHNQIQYDCIQNARLSNAQSGWNF